MTVPIWALTLPPLATLLAAILVAWIGWRTLLQRMGSDTASLNQKQHADIRASKQIERVTHKEQWWRRVQWAIDAAAATGATEERRAIGLGVLGLMDAFSDLEDDGDEHEGGE